MEVGRGSGGEFAYGEYARGDRRLELHFRYSLGLVTYHTGSNTLSHEAYMKALGAGSTEAQYPRYSDDLLDGFRHLAAGDDFLSGDAAVLAAYAPLEAQERADEWRMQKARYEGEDTTRHAAVQLVRGKDCARALLWKAHCVGHDSANAIARAA